MRDTVIAAAAVVLAQGALPAAGQTVPMAVLFAVGDIAECTSSPSETFKSGKAVADLIKAQIEKARADAGQPDLPVGVLALGDLAYDHGTPESFQCFDQHWAALKSVLFPVPGNHEYDKKLPNGQASSSGTNHAKPYFAYFTDAPGGDRWKNTVKQNGELAGFYFVDFPENADPSKRWRLIGLNSSTGVGAQTARLKADLAATRAAGVRCVLGFSHAFYYSSGRHGHGHVGSGPANAALKPESSMKGVFKALHEGGASLFVAGHDHHFEQLGRANAEGKDADRGAAAQAADGVRSFIVGTGGTQLHSRPPRPGTGKPNNLYDRRWAFQEAYNLTGYGVLKLELHDGFYTWEWVPASGQPGELVIVKALPENRDSCNR
jgi:hypothetical protein